jgi:hypothetical protein
MCPSRNDSSESENVRSRETLCSHFTLFSAYTMGKPNRLTAIGWSIQLHELFTTFPLALPRTLCPMLCAAAC